MAHPRPPQTVIALHNVAGWWLNHGMNAIRTAYPGTFPEVPKRTPRQVNTPPDIATEAIRSYASSSHLLYYDRTPFQLSSLSLDRLDLPSGVPRAHGQNDSDIFMNESIIIDETDPMAAIDPIIIYQNPQHTYVLALYIQTLRVFSIQQTLIGKWLQRLRSYVSATSFCVSSGWEPQSNHSLNPLVTSAPAQIVLNALGRCSELHSARADLPQPHRTVYDGLLPLLNINDAAACMFLGEFATINMRVSLQMAIRNEVASYVINQMVAFAAAQNIYEYSMTYEDVGITCARLAENISQLRNMGDTGLGTMQYAFPFGRIFTQAYVQKEGSLATRIKSFSGVWDLDTANFEANPFKHPTGQRNMWLFMLTLVEFTLVEEIGVLAAKALARADVPLNPLCAAEILLPPVTTDLFHYPSVSENYHIHIRNFEDSAHVHRPPLTQFYMQVIDPEINKLGYVQ